MPQEADAPDRWELDRESIELIPLTVETYTAASGWVATTNYSVTACAVGSTGTRNYVSASTDGGRTGYLFNGPVLGRGVFEGFTKIDGSVQDPVKPAFIVRVK